MHVDLLWAVMGWHPADLLWLGFKKNAMLPLWKYFILKVGGTGEPKDLNETIVISYLN